MNQDLIIQKIYDLRGVRVMLDHDLAQLYETETKYLKRAVRMNMKRFPADFMFVLTKEEYENLRCNFSTSSFHGGTRYLPFAFTEQGVAMLSAVLHSDKAIDVNLSIMRAFVMIRKYALTYSELAIKLEELETTYNLQFKDVYEALRLLLQDKKEETDWENRERIGFKSNWKEEHPAP